MTKLKALDGEYYKVHIRLLFLVLAFGCRKQDKVLEERAYVRGVKTVDGHLFRILSPAVKAVKGSCTFLSYEHKSTVICRILLNCTRLCVSKDNS